MHVVHVHQLLLHVPEGDLVLSRILVTGSRSWTDARTLAEALVRFAKRGDTLVHGASVDADGEPCGLDWLADRMWTGFGPIEKYPAADFPTPLARNQFMVNLGAGVCLAFASRWASGTGHCARRARIAGIPTYDYGVDTSPGARPRG